MVDLRGWEIFSRLPQTPPPPLVGSFPDKSLSSLATAGRQLVLLFFPLQFFPLRWQVGSIHGPSLSGRHQSRHPHPCHRWTAPWPRTTWDNEDTHDHASPGTKLWPVILGIEISPSAPSLAAGAVRQTDHSPWRGPVLPSPRVGDDLPWQANHWVSSISSAPSPILQTFNRDRSSFLHSYPTHVYLSSSLSLGRFGHDQPAPWRQRFHHHPPPSLAKSLFRLRRCHVVSAITANPYSPVVHPVAKTFPPQVSQTLSQKHCRQFGLTGI